MIRNLTKVTSYNFPKPRPEHKFWNKPLYLVRTGSPIADNTMIFRCAQDLNKIEIRQIVEKLYNLPVVKVHTWNKVGKIMRNPNYNTRYRKKDFKKVFVEIKGVVPPEL